MARCEGTVTNPKSPNLGQQCGRQAMHGAKHCAMHGGRDEVSFEAVKKRIERPALRCTANSTSSGERCKNYAIHGSTVCRRHGGNLPTVKGAAKQRLLALVDPALAELQRIIDRPTTSDSDRLKAIQLVLDRTGLHAKTELTAEVELKPWESLVQGIKRDVPIVEADETRVIDAEVVEDGDDEDPKDVARAFIAEAAIDPPEIPDNVVELRSSGLPPKHLR